MPQVDLVGLAVEHERDVSTFDDGKGVTFQEGVDLPPFRRPPGDELLDGEHQALAI